MTMKRILGLTLTAIVLVAIAGCSTPYPITTGLSDLTAETRTRKTMGVDYREITSLTGSVQMPSVGMVFHYPNPPWYARWFAGAKSPNPNHLIGVSNEWPERSYALTMTTAEDPGLAAAVSNTVSLIEKIQQRLADGVRLSAQIAAINAQLVNKNVAADLKPGLSTNQIALLAAVATNDVEVAALRSNLTAVVCHPGIIVTQWAVSAEAGGSVEAGDVAGLTGRHSKSRSGYLVLGGLRTSMLFFGRDFQAFLKNMGDADYRTFRKYGMLTTYLLQCRHVAYTAGLDIQNLVSAYLTLDAKNLGGSFSSIDKIKLAAYAATATSLGNSGNLGDVTWSKKPIRFADIIVNDSFDTNLLACVSEKTATPQLEPGQGGAYPLLPITNDIKGETLSYLTRTNFSGVTESLIDTNELANWKTVYAVIAHAPRVFDQMRSGLLNAPTNWPPAQCRSSEANQPDHQR